jgi:DNA-binding response OmpR family regulator
MAPLAERFASPPEGAPDSGRSLRVLVADDDKDAVVTLAAVLRDEGYEVREVYRGDAVLGMIDDFQPDAVLLDIGMPGMTGYDVARTLRERLESDCPLLVAITGWKKSADRILGQIAGFDHYVTKPYSIDDLLDLLTPLFSTQRRGALRPQPSKQQRLLAEAARLIGETELARGLRVMPAVLESWIEGRAAMPHRQLLNLADLLVKLATKPAK